MIKVTTLLPFKDNDGTDLYNLHKKFEQSMLILFDAFTRMGRASGKWKNKEGDVYSDTHAVYVTVIPVDKYNEYKRMIHAFKRQTKQESIYVEITPITVELV